MSLGYLVRERIPFELSSSSYPGQQVAQDTYPQGQVTRESINLSLVKEVNVAVNIGSMVRCEIIDWYKKRKKKWMLFKVDFEKAFDSVSWKYLDYMLHKLGFGSRWRTWINNCLMSARTSILINGSPTSEFSLKRGLRQGDSLSPFLFIIVMEGLNMALNDGIASNMFHGMLGGRGGYGQRKEDEEEVATIALVIEDIDVLRYDLFQNLMCMKMEETRRERPKTTVEIDNAILEKNGGDEMRYARLCHVEGGIGCECFGDGAMFLSQKRGGVGEVLRRRVVLYLLIRLPGYGRGILVCSGGCNTICVDMTVEMEKQNSFHSDLAKFRWLAKTLKDSPNEPPFRTYQHWKKAIYEEALRISDQMHLTCEKCSLAMTHKLDDMIELPKTQPKKTYEEDLECETVIVKIPRCMSWLDSNDAYDKPIGSLGMMGNEVGNPSPQSTPQVLPSFEEYTSPVTYLEEVEETIGIPMGVEPLDET
nr:cysteine-rich receptor-like protein kinase [Tanacetum cinerariifolium]